MSHRALFRDDRGNLQIRSFPTAAEAAAASSESRDLVLPPPVPRTIHALAVMAAPVTPTVAQLDAIIARKGGNIKHSDFARRLGIHPRTVKRQWLRGGLPGAVQHSTHILMVPAHLLRVAQAYGLAQVERMAKAGLL